MKRDVKRKTAAAIFLILALAMVLFFTLQKPEQSRDLSEAVRMWLGNIGIQVEYKSLRSNIHILEYIIVGLAVCGFCRSRGWKVWIGAGIGCGIGVVDESFKALLPGREFSTGDLVRDWIGTLLAIVVISIIRMMRNLMNNHS